MRKQREEAGKRMSSSVPRRVFDFASWRRAPPPPRGPPSRQVNSPVAVSAAVVAAAEDNGAGSMGHSPAAAVAVRGASATVEGQYA